MNRKFLFILWAFLFILCAGLGFIPEPEGTLKILCTAASVLSFLPPALLLYGGHKHTVRLIRNLAAMSLGLTVVLLIMNFLVAFRSEVLGQILHYMLIIISSPMICSGHWALSLFLWACLLMGSLKQNGR